MIQSKTFMKAVMVWFAAVGAIGCARSDASIQHLTEPPELGTAEQEIWVAEYVGWQGPLGLRCNPNNATQTCFLARGNATGLPGSAAYNRFEYQGGSWPTIRAALDTFGFSTTAATEQAAQYIIDNTGFGWAFGDLGGPGLYDLEWAFNEQLYNGTPPLTQDLPITQVTSIQCVVQSAPLTESPVWPATFRYCDRVRVTLDTGSIAAWINGQTANQVKRNGALRSLFVNVKGSVIALGRNTLGGAADIMWWKLPAGLTDPGFSAVDLCLANSIDLSANPNTVSVVNGYCGL